MTNQTYVFCIRNSLVYNLLNCIDPLIIIIWVIRNRNDFDTICWEYRFNHSLAFCKCKGISNVTSCETGTDDYDDFFCLLKRSINYCFVSVVERLESSHENQRISFCRMRFKFFTFTSRKAFILLPFITITTPIGCATS